MQQASEACPHVRPSTWYYRTNCACAKYGILTLHLFKGKLVGSKKAASNDITLVPNSHSPSHVLVHIKQSKTDPFRQGRTITITKSLSPICSVMAMKDYISFKPSHHQATLCSPSSNPDTGLHGTISQQSLGQFFNTVVSLPKISTPTVSVLEPPQLQPKLAFYPGLLKF